MDTPQEQGKAGKKLHHAPAAAATPQALISQPVASSPAPASHVPVIGLVGLAIVLSALGYGLYKLLRHVVPATDSDGFAKADYSVPHCSRFEKTAEGFRVTFRKVPELIHMSFRQSHDNVSRGGSHGSGIAGLMTILGLFLGLFLSVTVGLLAWLWVLFFPTRIEVTRDAVIIKGRKLARADFGSFQVLHTRNIHPNEASAVLGYSYGSRSFKISGSWRERQATEVAAALNAHLASTPMAGDDHNPPPGALREAAMVTDF